MVINLLKPPALKEGDSIGVVAPAHPFSSDKDSDYYKQFLVGKLELEQMGFRVVEASNVGQVHWWSGGTPQQRADDINNFFRDSNINAIIAHDGGNDCMRLLEHLDYELIRQNPKPFIGFSNITNIHSALYTKVGLVGFHMGLLTYELGRYWQEANPEVRDKGKQLFKSVLTQNTQLGEIKSLTQWQNWRDGHASGRLFGGNLSMIDSLIGTPYFPSIEELRGSVFFWELDNSPTYRIERVLTHLKYAGVLGVISGMIVGKLVDMKPSTNTFSEPSNQEIVLECLDDYSFPIMAGVDFGHRMIQIPMLVGIQAEMNASDLKLTFKEAAVNLE